MNMVMMMIMINESLKNVVFNDLCFVNFHMLMDNGNFLRNSLRQVYVEVELLESQLVGGNVKTMYCVDWTPCINPTYTCRYVYGLRLSYVTTYMYVFMRMYNV